MADLVSDGRIAAECAIRTPQGTKVPDAAWFSSVRREQVKNGYGTREICAEIFSPANSDAEMGRKKKTLFLRRVRGSADLRGRREHDILQSKRENRCIPADTVFFKSNRTGGFRFLPKKSVWDAIMQTVAEEAKNISDSMSYDMILSNDKKIAIIFQRWFFTA